MDVVEALLSPRWAGPGKWGTTLRLHSTCRVAVLLGGSFLLACSKGHQETEPVRLPAQMIGNGESSAVPQARIGNGATKTRYVVVQRGYSVARIARAHRVSKKAIISANHLSAPYRLKPGERLKVPVPGAPVARDFA